MNFIRGPQVGKPSLSRRLMDTFANCYHFLKDSRREVWSICGKELHSQLPFSVLCALPSSERSYIQRLMFGSSFEERCLGRVWWWQFPRLMKNASVDHSVTLVGVHGSQGRSASARGMFVIPNWVSGEVDVPLDPAVMNSRSVRSDFKKILEHKFTYEVTRDPKQFEEFYREMHIPYTRLAHGDSAQIEPFEEFYAKLKDWDLVLVRGEAGYIAGQLITYEASGPRFYLVGVRDGSREYVKQRVLGAAYQFSFRHVLERGFHKAGLGFSRAFLNDGVLRYKQKLSQRINGCSGAGIAISVRPNDPAARSFLRNNPFIFRGPEGLSGAIFVEDSALAEAEEQQARKEYVHPGLGKLFTYRLPLEKVSSEHNRNVLPSPPVQEGSERVCAPESH